MTPAQRPAHRPSAPEPRAPITITLPWAVCASDNARHGLVRGRIRLTAAYRERLRGAATLVAGARRGAAITGRARLVAAVYAPDERRRDVTNLLKHLCDALTNGGALADDSQLDDVRVVRGAVDRANPRIELLLESAQRAPAGTLEPVRNGA